MVQKNLIVGIADIKIAKKPDKLITYALGSCVGIAIYDIKNNIGGLAHILLPSSSLFQDNDNQMKFADTAIPLLIRKLREAGAEKHYLNAKIAGGANMFYKTSHISFYDIGNSNVTIVQKKLNELKIPIISQDMGGVISRTMTLDLTRMEVDIKYYEGNLSKIDTI